MAENREYKSDVFSMLMEYPAYALEVYNALEGTKFDDPSLIEMKTLQKGISLSMRNDAAFIIESDLNIYEHQSTYNPNMPLRAFFYMADILGSIMKGNDIYSVRKLEIPTPKCIVFYNGIARKPEYEELRLSDLYVFDGSEPPAEIICKVYNINNGMNNELKECCPILKQYSVFVDMVKKNIRNAVADPVESAIDMCMEIHVLSDFFSERKQEVIKNMTIDMTYERRLEIVRAEEQKYGRAEGRAIGIAEGRAEGEKIMLLELIKRKIQKGKTLDAIAEELEEDIDTITPLWNLVNENPDKTPRALVELLNID